MLKANPGKYIARISSISSSAPKHSSADAYASLSTSLPRAADVLAAAGRIHGMGGSEIPDDGALSAYPTVGRLLWEAPAEGGFCGGYWGAAAGGAAT
eukprot:1183296-Prorocentrum_minimum.AAC.1